MSADAGDELARRIEADNELLQRCFIAAYPTLRDDEVLQMSGCTSNSVQAAAAVQWDAQRKVFAVPFEGQALYPAFQFKDSAPTPIIGRILALLANKLSSWQIAFWFVAENSWLDGRKPVDLLDVQSDAVIEAAAREVTETFT